ncbi:phage tail assembly chaperone [Hoeflea alexandrii]|uniref:phage tail assembly chaperone n=1 Tax=Hoeflea alexandrii TaxID=288436 RepID=UPI0035CEDE9C
MLRFGLGHLRLPPEAFWRLSLAELNALAGAGTRPETTTRSSLQALMALYPDRRGAHAQHNRKDLADDR